MVRATDRALFRVKDFQTWRAAARRQLEQDVPPKIAVFFDNWEPQRWLEFGISGNAQPRSERGEKRHLVPRAFLPMARLIACHRDPRRWVLLYRILWRLTHGEPRLLDWNSDDDVYLARRFEAQVRSDVQQVRATVQFRQVPWRGEPWFVAWCRPEHRVMRLAAPFFVDRFASMRWTILSAEESVSWDGQQLVFHAGTGHEVPDKDGLEEFWTTYFGPIFGRRRASRPPKPKFRVVSRGKPR